MKPMLLAAVLGLLAAPLAHAQQSPRSPDPADPNLAVPAPVYASAFAGPARSPQDSGLTPDKTWRRMNDALTERTLDADTDPAPAGHAAHASHTTYAAPSQASGHAHAPKAPAPASTQPAAPAAASAHTGHQHH